MQQLPHKRAHLSERPHTHLERLLLQLLLRFYDVSEGQIAVDGVPLQSADVQALRAAAAGAIRPGGVLAAPRFQDQLSPANAVTSISIRYLSSIKPHSIIVAAGGCAPKVSAKSGKHGANSPRSGSM